MPEKHYGTAKALYNGDESRVILKTISSNDQFVADWNQMGTEGEKTVMIDTVVMDTHADPTVITDNRNFSMYLTDNLRK